MTFNDQPNTPPIELVGGEPETESDDSDEESSDEESGFEFDSEVDEISEDIFNHYTDEQDHADLVQENLDLQQQNEALDVVVEATRKEKEQWKQAVKRKFQEREEFTRFKRLRVAIRDAYEFMGVAAPLIEGGTGGSMTGSDQAPVEEKVAAVTNFQKATEEARRCLEDLRLYQSQMMGEN